MEMASTNNNFVHNCGNASQERGIVDNLCTLRIGSLNCQGLNGYYTRIALFDYLKNTNLSIIFLQETKLKPENELDYIREWHNHKCIFNSRTGGKSGTAILFNLDSIKMIPTSKMIDLDGRVIAVDIVLFGDRFRLLNSYGPNEHQRKITFLERLYVYFGTGVNIIWGGDHNIATDSRIDRFPPHLSNDHGRTEFLQLLNTFDLVDNCRSRYPNGTFYTYRKGLVRSRIDKICTSSELIINEYSHEDTSFSDHDLVMSKISYVSCFDRGPGIWRNNIKYLGDEDLVQNLSLVWRICQGDPIVHSNLPKWWQDTKYKIKMTYINFSKQKGVLARRAAQMREQGLQNIIIALNNNPYDKKLATEYTRVKKHVVNLRIKETKERILKSDAHYLMHGDKPTKKFFDEFRNRSEAHSIRALKNDMGVEVTDIKDILHIAENFYKGLFSSQDIQQNEADVFLAGISVNQSCTNLMNSLLLPISDDEIKDVINNLKNGKSPGPDGLSIEFYKAMYPVIKEELRQLLNFYLFNGRMFAKFKAGIIKLIPKYPAYNEIENFRPISLLNVDYKIFTKIISNRIQPILEKIIHDSQYCMPGKDINQMNILVRDLVDEMKSDSSDAFFVSIDFRKAFDTISHNFLYQVLEKYGFPCRFIEIIMELFRDAGSHLLINGYKSKKIKLKSGTRQGDPISRDVFILVMNPLLEFLNACNLIRKYESRSKKEFLTLAYMDDLNYVTQSISGLMNALFYIKKFGKASGLQMNMQKTKGKFFNKKNIFSVASLPAISWEDEITVLKINHGPATWVQAQWDQTLTKLRKEVSYFGSVAHSVRAKAIISKSKLLAMLTYLCGCQVMPDKIRISIDKLLIKFLVPFLPVTANSADEIKRKFFSFATPRFLGGCEIDFLTLHADLLLLKPIMCYLKELKLNQCLISSNLYFVEYNVGMQLCNYFGIKINNCTPHAETPSFTYNYVLSMIKWFKITFKELTDGTVNSIYKRIVCSMNQQSLHFKSHRIFAKGLPSYLQSFNYKLHNDLLPVRTMFQEYALDNDSRCNFCQIGPESIFHLFGTCEKLKTIWSMLKEVYFLVSNERFDFQYSRINLKLDLTNIKCSRIYEKTLVYLNSIVNYSIWKMRNDIRFKFEVFDPNVLVKKVLRSVGARKNVDSKLSPSHQIPYIKELYDAMVVVCHRFPFDNG